MALSDTTLGGFFLHEYDRFTGGLATITGKSEAGLKIATGQKAMDPNKPRTINIPGWDDVIKFNSPGKPTGEELDTYYGERKQNKPSSLAPDRKAEIEAGIQKRDDRRQSAQDPSSAGWGQVMTAIDNVQDLVSTVSTMGRLAIWAAPRIPVALGLESTAIGAILGRVGLRAAARMVPVVGWVLLVSDLLNLLNLMGMLASPLYGLLCSGTKGFLSAAAPTALFKRGLCKEVWRKAHTNPFAREARVARQLKAASGRIGFGALLEVAQTTESLFGWGLSFGAIVGLGAEVAAAAQIALEGGEVKIVAPRAVTGQSQYIADAIGRRLGEAQSAQQMNTNDAFTNIVNANAAQRELVRQAAAVAATAPLLARVQEHFTDEEHLTAMVAWVCAIAILREYFAGMDLDTLVAELSEVPLAPPLLLGLESEKWATFRGLDAQAESRWWFPPYAATAPAGAMMDDAITQIPAAWRAWIEPRRNTADGVFFGALTSQLTEDCWSLVAGDHHALHWQLTTDWRLLADMASKGILWPINNDEAALMRAWKAARRELVRRDAGSLDEATWHALAERYGIEEWNMAPPDAPWPPPPASWPGTTDVELARPR
jgi:hypothetical protein